MILTACRRMGEKSNRYAGSNPAVLSLLVQGIFNDRPVTHLAFVQGLLDLLSFGDFLTQFSVGGGQGFGPLADILPKAVSEVLQPQVDLDTRQNLLLLKWFGDIIHCTHRRPTVSESGRMDVCPIFYSRDRYCAD